MSIDRPPTHQEEMSQENNLGRHQALPHQTEILGRQQKHNTIALVT